MNTERSYALVARYRDRSWRAVRKSYAWTKANGSPRHGGREE